MSQYSRPGNGLSRASPTRDNVGDHGSGHKQTSQDSINDRQQAILQGHLSTQTQQGAMAHVENSEGSGDGGSKDGGGVEMQEQAVQDAAALASRAGEAQAPSAAQGCIPVGGAAGWMAGAMHGLANKFVSASIIPPALTPQPPQPPQPLSALDAASQAGAALDLAAHLQAHTSSGNAAEPRLAGAHQQHVHGPSSPGGLLPVNDDGTQGDGLSQPHTQVEMHTHLQQAPTGEAAAAACTGTEMALPAPSQQAAALHAHASVVSLQGDGTTGGCGEEGRLSRASPPAETSTIADEKASGVMLSELLPQEPNDARIRALPERPSSESGNVDIAAAPHVLGLDARMHVHAHDGQLTSAGIAACASQCLPQDAATEAHAPVWGLPAGGVACDGSVAGGSGVQGGGNDMLMVDGGDGCGAVMAVDGQGGDGNEAGSGKIGGGGGRQGGDAVSSPSTPLAYQVQPAVVPVDKRAWKEEMERGLADMRRHLASKR